MGGVRDPTTSERAFWYRFDDPPRLADGRLDPFALLTLCDTMPGAVGERMGGGLPEWWAPSADLTVHLLGDHRAEWVLARNRARHAGDGYASLEVELWDADAGTLVAYATQMMIFTFPGRPAAARAPRARGTSGDRRCSRGCGCSTSRPTGRCRTRRRSSPTSAPRW